MNPLASSWEMILLSDVNVFLIESWANTKRDHWRERIQLTSLKSRFFSSRKTELYFCLKNCQILPISARFEMCVTVKNSSTSRYHILAFPIKYKIVSSFFISRCVKIWGNRNFYEVASGSCCVGLTSFVTSRCWRHRLDSNLSEERASVFIVWRETSWRHDVRASELAWWRQCDVRVILPRKWRHFGVTSLFRACLSSF